MRALLRLVILSLLAAPWRVVGDGGDGGDSNSLRSRCCEQLPGSVQIVHPAQGAWLPMDNKDGGAHGQGTDGNSSRERTSLLLEFVVVDSPLLAWLPPDLLPLAPALLPHGTCPSAGGLHDQVLADVLIDGEIWGTIDLHSCIFAGMHPPGDTQRRRGVAKGDGTRRGSGELEEEAGHLRNVKQERDGLLAEWSKQVAFFACTLGQAHTTRLFRRELLPISPPAPERALNSRSRLIPPL
jgi:hypothetical protein